MQSTTNQQKGEFPTTSFTLYQQIHSDKPGDSAKALETFFSRYWYPLYVFMRAKGESHFDASDLVQEFIMTELIDGEQLAKWDPEKGSLRTFLRTILDRFRKKEFRKACAIKRGGKKSETHISMDLDWAGEYFEKSCINEETPMSLFEREWASLWGRRPLNLPTAISKKEKKRNFCFSSKI